MNVEAKDTNTTEYILLVYGLSFHLLVVLSFLRRMKTQLTHSLLIVLHIIFFVSVTSCYAQEYSRLWGRNGEAWDKKRLPDFTRAGYKEGQTPPQYQRGINVIYLGAKGDGKTDNTAAFRKAIRQCPPQGTVYIPAGTYLISDTLLISRSGICIKGEGPGKTKLLFSKGLEELYPNYHKTYPNQSEWSWSGAMILFSGSISGSGIEDLSIIFPDRPWVGHNFHERAYNGIGFSNGAHDGWIRNVTLTGCDMGIWIEKSAHHITAEHWQLDFDTIRQAGELQGHHGVNIYGGYNLFQYFQIKGKFQHDLSVESQSSHYNVFRAGKAMDLCIDHHNHAQAYNLFTNLDAGIGSRLYFSGGVETPRGICFHETFWNILAKYNLSYCDQMNSPQKQSANNVSVGIKTNRHSQLGDAHNNWFETINPANLIPQDLYKAQYELKNNRLP